VVCLRDAHSDCDCFVGGFHIVRLLGRGGQTILLGSVGMGARVFHSARNILRVFSSPMCADTILMSVVTVCAMVRSSDA